MKYFRLVNVLAVAFALCGCADCPPPYSPVVLNEGTKSAEYVEGEEVAVALKGNPTTGYQWKFCGVAEPVLKYVGSHYDAPDTKLVGAGGTYYFSFVAAQKGTCKLKFEYLRTWENAPVQTEEFDITVK